MSGDNSTFGNYTDFNTDHSAIGASVRSALSEMGTHTLAQVKAVHGGGAAIVGTVDVQPMVHQQDGDGNPLPHGTIYGVPYLRVQGGASALIIDPQPGDIGYVIVSGRDISRVVATRAPAAPGSFRMHDMADIVYVGGYLNAAPSQYILMTQDGMRIVTPNTLTIQAASVAIQCNVSVQGNVTATGDVQAGSISLESHVHGGVQGGSGTTGAPE